MLDTLESFYFARLLQKEHFEPTSPQRYIYLSIMLMLRSLLVLLLLLASAFVKAQPIDSLRQAALLAARGDIPQLRPIYKQVRNRLPLHTELYCRLAFARAVGNSQEVIALIDTLERKYERKFDVRGLLALAQERCEALRYQGDWAALSDYAQNRLDWAKRRGIRVSRKKELEAFKKLGTALLHAPSPSVDWQESQFSITRLPNDSLPTISVFLNGQEVAPALLTPFGRHTIVAASVLSQLGQDLHEVPTLAITTAEGNEEMKAVKIDSLRIGSCTFRNLVVYAFDDNNMKLEFPILLGLDLLRRLSCLTVSKERILVQKTPSNQYPTQRQIAFSPGGWLMVREGEEPSRPFKEEDFYDTCIDFEHLYLY